MGEYAMRGQERVKIGTCEDMLYLRADQRHAVYALSGNVDPVRDAAHLRFRFPWPTEDDVAPGAFEDPFYGISFHTVSVPDGVEHGNVQFCAQVGYLVSLPCPESPEGKASPLKVHRNGFQGAVKLVQQRLIDGKLVAICECGGCRTKYRLETLEDAQPLIDECLKQAAQWRAEYRPDEHRARWYEEIAARIRAGYTQAA